MQSIMLNVYSEFLHKNKRLVIFVALALSAVIINFFSYHYNRTNTSEIYKKYDFYQFYILARGTQQQIDLDQKLPELARQILGDNQYFFEEQHANPYPPAAGIILSPLSLFTYQDAAKIWLFLRLLLTSLTIIIVCRINFKKSGILLFLSIFILLAYSDPFYRDAYRAQINYLLLFLCALYMRLYVKRSYRIAGLILGLSICLKFYGIPFIIHAFLKGKKEVLLYCCLTFLIINFAAIDIYGAANYINYWQNVTPVVPQIVGQNDFNFSFLAVVKRFLETLNIKFPFESAAVITSVLSLLMILKASSIKSASVSLNILLATCVLMQPMSWGCTLLPLALPIYIMFTKSDFNANMLPLKIILLVIWYFSFLDVDILRMNIIGSLAYSLIKLFVPVLTIFVLFFQAKNSQNIKTIS